MSTPQTQPSPILFFETISAYQRSSAIKAAIDLELFTAIAEGNSIPSTLATRCKADERGIRILCDFLTATGFLTKSNAGYALTQDSAIFLNKNLPSYMGSAVDFMLSPVLTSGFDNLTEAVRKGGTTLPDEGTVTPDNPVWVDFARAMAPMMTVPAQIMTRLITTDPSRKLKVLDIAAGHGMYGITFAQSNPNAEIVALDWENVLNVAKENAQKAGISDRYSTIVGNAFDVDFGSDYDMVLITNFLHHFDIDTCETLLRKVNAALVSGGRAATVEFVPNDDRVTPPPSAMFSLVMLSSTPHGDAYTFKEYQNMFSNTGFSRSEFHQLDPTPQQLIVSTK